MESCKEPFIESKDDIFDALDIGQPSYECLKPTVSKPFIPLSEISLISLGSIQQIKEKEQPTDHKLSEKSLSKKNTTLTLRNNYSAFSIVDQEKEKEEIFEE